ncbi:MAG: hypothetical protein FGF53_04045 [Candidatus Brockarchaeota archaeon]|nr:hypothetical protein [Candidatus Brockarchaeota archaeon]MBO3808508.1 hypothetical protein [Candidatus Brockarchaeota archaeon]
MEKSLNSSGCVLNSLLEFSARGCLRRLGLFVEKEGKHYLSKERKTTWETES